MIISWKLCRNLCSFRWLKSNLKRLNSFRPLILWTSKTEFYLVLTKFRILVLNVFTEFIFPSSSYTCIYNEIIDKPTHYINESSLCIDLVFSSNVNLTKNCRVEQSLYETCHHNIIYGTLNFNYLFSPPYFREIWDYKNGNIECIQKSIYVFHWIRAFQNRRCNEKCKILSETLFNIFPNFIPHKSIKTNYKIPEWINRSIKLSLKKRSKLTKRYHSKSHR